MKLNNILNSNFNNAAEDYLYLLNKKYPHKPVLKLIGDKYRLTKTQRSILFRGISNSDSAEIRKSKLIDETSISNQVLIIDTYNILISIGSYLEGKFVYIGNDGFLRDTAEAHGKLKKNEYLEKSLNILIEYLKILQLKKIIFYIDSPISHSKKLKEKINSQLSISKINGDAKLVKSADFFLIETEDGICTTSDSNIIDNRSKIFDLAYYTLKYYFNPDFIKLEFN